jgi:hypothetical protein
MGGKPGTFKRSYITPGIVHVLQQSTKNELHPQTNQNKKTKKISITIAIAPIMKNRRKIPQQVAWLAATCLQSLQFRETKPILPTLFAARVVDTDKKNNFLI